MTLDHVGRVIGKDPSGYILVRLDHRVMAEYGELWIIDDVAQSTKYFVRVVDTMYGVDGSRNENVSSYAKSLMDNPEVQLDDLDREMIGYSFAQVALLGSLSGNKIGDYYRIPSILAKVRKPNDPEFALIVA